MEDRAPDGGMYLPRELPRLTEGQLQALYQKTDNGIIAEVLNLLLGTCLSEYDVDFAVGRRCLRISEAGRRMVICESWHNTEHDFSQMLQGLSRKLSEGDHISFWGAVAVRTAVIAAFIGKMIREGMLSPQDSLDVASAAGEMSAAAGALYAQTLGFPVGRIMVCCNENHFLWDMLHQGQLRTDAVCKKTSTADTDILLPRGLEYMIHRIGGSREVRSYQECCREGKTYTPEDAVISGLNQIMTVGVVSESRVRQTIAGVWSAHSCLLSPYAAIAYAAVQDFRARNQESRFTMVLSEKSPDRDPEVIASALDIDYKGKK